MNTLREYIQRRQEELGLSQNQLALKSGKTSSWLSKFMSGERKDMKVDALIALAKALRVPEAKLIAAYKGHDPDQVSDLSNSQHVIEDIIALLLKNVSHQVFVEALLAVDGPEKMQEYWAEAKKLHAEKKNAST